MARIAKHRIHQALDQAAQNLKLAGGPDKRISRADMKHAGDNIEDKVEKDLTNMFGKFCDHRDAGKGNTLGHDDIDKTLAYAKEKLVDAKDVNNNGLSEKEIGNMSTTGQLAALLAAKNF